MTEISLAFECGIVKCEKCGHPGHCIRCMCGWEEDGRSAIGHKVICVGCILKEDWSNTQRYLYSLVLDKLALNKKNNE